MNTLKCSESRECDVVFTSISRGLSRMNSLFSAVTAPALETSHGQVGECFQGLPLCPVVGCLSVHRIVWTAERETV